MEYENDLDIFNSLDEESTLQKSSEENVDDKKDTSQEEVNTKENIMWKVVITSKDFSRLTFTFASLDEAGEFIKTAIEHGNNCEATVSFETDNESEDE